MKKIGLLAVVVSLLLLSGCGKSVNFDDTDTITFHDLTVSIPKVFIHDEENSNDKMTFYAYNDNDDNACMVYFSFSDYPNGDARESIKFGFLDKEDFTVTEKTINDNKWSIGYREESKKQKQSFYVITVNGKEYNMSYDDFGSGEDCAKALKVIEKSLTLK